MLDTKRIIANLEALPNDDDRVKKICEKPSFGNKPSLIHAFVDERPQDIPKLLQTLSDLEKRANVMKLHLDCLNEKYIPAILTCLRAKDRLDYIRQEDSGATEYGKSSNAEFKYINFVIYCDLYLEHLMASTYSFPTRSQELTALKIKVIEDARAILTDNPESEETIQDFYAHLVNHHEDLAKRRDTRLTSFLRSVGLTCLVDYAYKWFIKTDGKVLIDKIEAIEQKQQPKP
ncbi:MAG: hypothetical protein P1U39_01555 [Legionellaceae bacterium]|nr:hypothetical protein [Legionellaceae bacterium]